MVQQFNIDSVAQYIDAIKSIPLKEGYQRFYHGVSDFDYVDKDYPSIFRDENLIKNEHELFYELVSNCPDNFVNCKNTFEHLVLMQHYEFPTRLLDVTENPLVALYFACTGNKDNEGNEIKIIINEDKKNILTDL